MKTTKNDVYIKILKYARDKPGFTFQQIMDAFPEQRGLIKQEITRKSIFIDDASDSDKYKLTFEGRFYLLEYEELKEARKSSQNAMLIAIISILLTFFSILYSSSIVGKVEVTNLNEISQSIPKQTK